MDLNEDPVFEDNKYLLELHDVDGDTLTMSTPWAHEDKIMMRIENDDAITGIIVDLPMALAMISILLPMIQQAKLDKAWDEFMNPEKDAF